MATPMAGPRLRVTGLGPLTATTGDREIDLGPPKQRAVFAVLALCSGVTVSRDEMVARVWGESAPATAAGSLHTYLTGLRRALGDAQDLLISDRAGYRLRLDRAMFDVARTEDLATRARTEKDPALYEEALALWPAGTLFAAVPGPFVAQTRERLAGLRLRLLIEHAELAPPAAGVAERLLAEVPAHPFDERLRVVLMRVLQRGGRTSDALAQYADLRRVLAADLGISPSPATQAAYAEILDDDRPPTVTVTRPAQLPHDNEAFVGRSDELLVLVGNGTGRALRRRGIVTVVGVGGIGKTSLAVRAGHLLRDTYPDGQIYLNLRGFDPSHTALTPDAALQHLLTSVGARNLPGGREERTALWRSLLADKRMLVILDNAASAEQIEDLLPGGSTCFVIVTSRNRLAGMNVRHGARRIPLGPLTVPESLDLLGTTVGPDRVDAEPESARRLAELCDRSPFALQIAAEQVVSTAGVKLGDLVGQLEDVQHRLDALQLPDDPLLSVRGVLSWSFAALGAGEARAFRMLGVLPGTSVTRDNAAALFGVAPGQAGAWLSGLAALSLLEQDGERFTMHDLVRSYAAGLSSDLDPEERQAALTRLLEWYRATVSRAGNGMVDRGWPITPPRTEVPPVLFDSQRDCLLWCIGEAQNILALLRAAGPAGLYAPAWHLTALMFDYFYTAGHPAEWLELLDTAMHGARAEGNRVARAILHNHSSVAWSRMGRNEIAVRQLRLGLALLDGPDDWRFRISLLGNLASTLREAKLYAAALNPALEALELAEREGIDYYLAATHDVLCELYSETGHWAEAIGAGEPGLVYARRSHSQIIEANLLINVGRARHGLGGPEAEAAFAEALRISEDSGDRYHQGVALFGLARVGAPGEDTQALARRALLRFEELDAEEAGDVRDFLASGG
ncbi:AfsR/SARP family transcriptional regulator [Actinoplanes couchii]|uniref:SARP family transcriptional regulator n=1 Tax=Actinoplanes couchii TaxID=403638 RepID=A0ABQ3X3U5_9ACTN|nr:BTAD domain-containing putative transcriptional regulator [Actinoplanes couchii]MDR6322932.1 DNA-binding SARP family transcriptional activator/tetratricopeptide (TPR) repeat protein [Actinoplanes couchii]GID53172.1 SARP family transcriptional regulator [Actinoplanes couchii]